MNNHDKAREQVRAQYGDDVDFSTGTPGYGLATLIEGHLDKLDELRRELDLASWPSVDHANAMLKAAAAEHARLVAEGGPPLKPHEILAVFREAGCLYEREDSDLRAYAQELLSSFQNFASNADGCLGGDLEARAAALGLDTEAWLKEGR